MQWMVLTSTCKIAGKCFGDFTFWNTTIPDQGRHQANVDFCVFQAGSHCAGSCRWQAASNQYHATETNQIALSSLSELFAQSHFFLISSDCPAINEAPLWHAAKIRHFPPDMWHAVLMPQAADAPHCPGHCCIHVRSPVTGHTDDSLTKQLKVGYLNWPLCACDRSASGGFSGCLLP